MSLLKSFENIKVVALDWDGTVVDSVPYKLAQNQAIAHEFGKDLSLSEVRREWNDSSGFPDLMYRLTGTRDIDAIIRVVKRDYNNPAYAKRNFTFSHIALPAIRTQGFGLGAITNATREILEMDAYQLGFELNKDFDFTQAVDECEHKKPDGRVFDPLLRHFGITASQLLYIGDEMKDYQAAQNAGANFLGVTTGMSTGAEFTEQNIPFIRDLASLYSEN